jgi:sulfur carrier protein
MSLTLVLNGQPRTFTTLPEPPSLDHVITELGLKGDRVAVEHNGEIVPRTTWAQTILSAGDRLEVVHFVGGGSVSSDIGNVGGDRALVVAEFVPKPGGEQAVLDSHADLSPRHEQDGGGEQPEG